MDKFGKWLFGFLIGGVVGSAAALLYSPKNGEDIREQLHNGWDEIKLNFDLGVQEKREELEDEIRHLRGEA